MQVNDWLGRLNQEILKEYSQHQRVLSFEEYMALTAREPSRQLRSSAQYLAAVMDHFGRSEDGHFNLFDQSFVDGRFRLIGHERVQEKIYQILQSFIREGQNNKLILLHGPNGSAKSSIISCLMRAAEEYSHTDSGALYRFNWIFPIDKYLKQSLGLGSKANHDSRDSYARLEDTEIAARIPCDLKDHPLFLIPEEDRRDFIGGLNLPKEFRVAEYLAKGDLSQKSRQIYEALLRSYKGDFRKVLQHVQVERFYISQRYRESAVTIEPQMQVDAHAQQVTMDKSLGMLPASLQSLNLINVGGDLIEGNRGLIEYNDLLKRPIEAFKYLLATCESGTVNVGGSTAFLDTILIGTCNELQLDAFKEYPDFVSFKARIELVRVPYLLKVGQEREIYSTQVERVAGGQHVAPHTIELAALWAVLCRLKKPNAIHYPSSLAYLINSLNPLEKARLYDEGEMPTRLSADEQKLLRANLKDLAKEYADIPYYEGRSGPSPREIKLILFEALESSERHILSPIGLFNALREFVKRTSEYEYLRENVVEGYHDATGFIELLKELYLDRVDDEVRSSVGMYDERQFGDFLERYVHQVSASLKNEKIRNPITNKSVDPDQNLMEEFERVVRAGEDRRGFRQNLITQIGVYSLEHPNDMQGAKPNYAKMFPDLMKRMRDHYQNEQANLLRQIHDGMLLYLAPEEGRDRDKEYKEPQTVEQRKYAELAKNLLREMRARYGYNDASAREAFSFLVQKRN
jgi:serine protein kinase